ncbi:MAG TPA: sce7726 family protein [Bacteroidales bacterium]|nr:sce7726 family protein [Bacteroidales bacterium]
MKDFEIRRSLHRSFLSDYTSSTESLVVDELKVCNGRAIMDVAVINGSLLGFEIKSSNDNLSRLSNQMTSYNKVFDYITIVTCNKHLSSVLKEVPLWWGVWVVENGGLEISKIQMRPPSLNCYTEAFSIAQFLWKTEIQDLIDKRGLDSKMKNKRKWIQWQYLADSLELQDLKCEVRSYLKSRINWKSS